jgi:hypothetical protein
MKTLDNLRKDFLQQNVLVIFNIFVNIKFLNINKSCKNIK